MTTTISLDKGISLILPADGNELEVNRKNIVNKKIKVKDGFFDIRSVLEVSDEVLALAGEKRYGDVVSIEKRDDNYLEIDLEF